MGDFFKHLKCGINIIFLVISFFSSGSNSVELNVPEQVVEARPFVYCHCKPCMTGPKCEEKVSELNPRFSQRYFFVELTDDYQAGSPLPYNSTSYPGGKDCPCGDFEYILTDVRNAMEEEGKPTTQDVVFSIDKKTGEIRINRPLKDFEMYKLLVTVRNTLSNATDETKITVALKPPTSRINHYSPEVLNGYEDMEDEYSHHIQKRSVIPADDVNITLITDSSTNEMRVGSKVKFTVEIVFPLGDTDMLVELFTPDNETTVMILCAAEVRSVGANLSPSVGTPTVVIESKEDDTIKKPDRGVIELGIVTNDGSDTANIEASTIIIDWEAIMISNTATVDQQTYWVSAGAEYNNESTIWVGQASFVAINDGNLTVAEEPTFNVGMPTNLALGGSALVPVDMYLPYPSASYIFNVFTPLNTSGAMSVCSIMYNDAATNFGCGNDMSLVNTTVTEDATSVGNSHITMYLGTLLNKGSRDQTFVLADNRVTLYFVLHMYDVPDLLGSTLTVGITLEVDTSVIWVGNADVIVDPEVTTGLTDPSFVSLTTDLTNLVATIGEPFKVVVAFSIPAPTTAGVATPYTLEVLAPFSTTGIFKLCSFEIISVGRDLPCVNKDEAETTYYTRGSSGSVADRATIGPIHIMNIDHFRGTGDDIIELQAIFSPVADHPSAVDGSTHTITFGSSVGTASVILATEDITLNGTSTITELTNDTAPTFTMSYYNSATDPNADQVSVLESTKINIAMATNRNTKYTNMDMEFLMPVDDTYAYVHVCKAEIESAGKNLPCLTPEWTNDLITYESKFSINFLDRAKMDVGGICNKEIVDDTAEDNALFAMYIKVLNVPTVSDMDEFWVSTGLMYSDSQMWVGQLKLKVRTGENISPASPHYLELSDNSTLSPIPHGYYGVYSLLLKLTPGDRADLEITATVDNPGLDICSIRVTAVGANLPCVIDDLATKTYGAQTATIDLDVVTDFGTGSLTSNGYFDSDSIIVEVLLNADPAVAPGSYQLDVTTYFDTSKAVSETKIISSITTTSDISAISTTVSTAVTGSLSVGEIAFGDTDANIAVGETKRILFNVIIPDESIYQLKIAVTIPSTDVGKLELCDAAIFSAGKHLPCIDTSQAPTITSVGGIYDDSAEFDLDYVCNRPVIPGNNAENTLTIEAWVRLLPNTQGLAAIGSSVTVAGTITTFGNSVQVDTQSLTVTDPALFVDKFKSLDGVTNNTLISIDQSSPFPMTIGENKTIQVTVTVPAYSVSRFLFDVDLPYNSVSACMTVTEILVTSSIGANIPCFGSDETKGLTFTPLYNSALNTSQMTYGYLDMGIITNTGKTHRLGTYSAGDDDVVLEVTLQMADCSTSDNASVTTFSLGQKLASVIYIYYNDVTVSRDGNERPDFVLLLTGTVVTDTLINIDGILYHSALSTAEAKNTSVVIQLADYLIAPSVLVSASLSTYVITSDSSTPNTLEIFLSDVFFSDYFTFRAAITVDTSVYVPNGFSSADTSIFSEVVTEYVSRASTYDGEDWFPYPTAAGSTLSLALDTSSGDGCTVSNLGLYDGTIADCQISGSFDYLSGFPPQMARLNGASAWKPGIRSGALARNRYFQVYFGNQVQLYEFQVSQTTTTDLATEVLVEYSNDGVSWFSSEQVYLGDNPSTSETRTLATAQKTRYVRIKITNDTNNLEKSELGLNFEFYGCTLTSDVSDPCASITSSVARPSDFYTRSFLEHPTAGDVFVCDSDPSSSEQRGRCHRSTDGTSWTEMDERLGSLIGIEESENRLYGYDNDMKTVLVSTDAGVTWSGADVARLSIDKLKSWTAAIDVPLDQSFDLDQATPTSIYTFSSWGATYGGLFQNNVAKHRWT